MSCEACRRSLPTGCLRFCWSCLRLQPAGTLTLPELAQLVDRRRLEILGRGRLVDTKWTADDGEVLVVHGRVFLSHAGDPQRVEILDATTEFGDPRLEGPELCRRRDFDRGYDAVHDRLVEVALEQRHEQAEPSSVDEARER